MSRYGSWKDATISGGATKTDEIDIGFEYDYLNLLIPGMDTCKLSLEIAEKSDDAAGEYYKLGEDVSTDVGNFNRADTWRLGGFRYVKLVSSVIQGSSRTIRIRGWKN